MYSHIKIIVTIQDNCNYAGNKKKMDKRIYVLIVHTDSYCRTQICNHSIQRVKVCHITFSAGFTHTLTTLKRRAADFWGRQIFEGNIW